MSLIPHLFFLIMLQCIMGAPDPRVDDINTFLTIAWQVAESIRPNSSCYVCGLMPFTAGEGLPLMALPASDRDVCRLLHLPLPPPRPDRVFSMRPLNCSGGRANCQKCLTRPKPVPVQLVPQPFPWCLENKGGTPVGRSTCLQTFRGDSRLPNMDFGSPASGARSCLEAAGRARFNALARRTSGCSISSPVGMFWVCGRLAYPYLPVDYDGRCGLAYVVPAMRTTLKLPQKTPHRRARRGVSDIFGTHRQSGFKNILGALLPVYGVMSALDQIADLSRAVEVIANQTGKALLLISSELASVRLLALQNRAALDFLLAAQGGTCAIIGSECCTFVPDYNATINDIVNHLHESADAVHQEGGSLLDMLGTYFGANVYHIFQMIIFFIVFIVFVSLFTSCVKKFVFNMI